MYLKSIKTENFRKIKTRNNKISFVDFSKENKIAQSTSLIVGKNNSGKTTIIRLLDKLFNEKKFVSNDFNYRYILELIECYEKYDFDIMPNLAFEIVVCINDMNNELFNNIFPLTSLDDIKADEQVKFKFIIRYEIVEDQLFQKEVISNLLTTSCSLSSRFNYKNRHGNLILNYNIDFKYTWSCKYDKFNKFMDILDNTKFKLNYYDINDNLIDSRKNVISELIDIKIVSTRDNLGKSPLSKTFNKIIKYKYTDNLEIMNGLQDRISSINDSITTHINKTHTESVKNMLNKIESQDRVNVSLSSDLNFEKLMNDLIKYEYIEGKFMIPEEQFGLGYTNLMAILGELIDYVAKYPDDDLQSKVNLICIEEPETYMHPQMQELFIKHINDAIEFLLDNSEKKLNTQLIVTTHSSHILNSKIHTSNTFDNINYLTTKKGATKIINLTDSEILEKNVKTYEGELEEEFRDRKTKDLNFIKKHIKFKVSELFFSDAIIFVEGITEYVLLSYLIDQNEDLNKYYITIFNIDGSHGHMYHPLIKVLDVPTLVITDLDIKRSDNEKENFSKVSILEDRETTNYTIQLYNDGDNNISNLPESFLENNINVVFQSKIDDSYPTSFEESLILTNYENEILKKSLEKTMPQIYKDIRDDEDNNLKENSYKLQVKLGMDSRKSSFANQILYEMINNEENLKIDLPDYISNGLEWLKVELKKDIL